MFSIKRLIIKFSCIFWLFTNISISPYYQRSIIFAVDSALQHFSLPLVRSMNCVYEKITLRDTEYVLRSNDETFTGSCGLAVEEL